MYKVHDRIPISIEETLLPRKLSLFSYNKGTFVWTFIIYCNLDESLIVFLSSLGKQLLDYRYVVVFFQVEVIDIDSLLESCGQSEVTVEDVKEAEGYLEIKDGHTKVIFKD